MLLPNIYGTLSENGAKIDLGIMVGMVNFLSAYSVRTVRLGQSLGQG
jgi:hypothetical protein